MRVCRVQPDLPAVEREFDYLVPDDIRVDVGTIVRIPLLGRRVRGWVTAVDVEPETDPTRLKALLAVSSAGPPADVIELARWVAHRYCGALVHVLRAASPPNNADRARVGAPGVVRQPGSLPPSHTVVAPATDRRATVAEHVAPMGSTIVITPAPGRVGPLAAHLEKQGRRVVVFNGSAPDAARTRAWITATHGDCVVIGGRTAVFAPVPDLEAVLVLDDFDEALAEERVPTWNAREVAAERARRAYAAFSIITPLPTPEGLFLASAPTALDRTAMRDGWPIVDVIDMRDGPPRGLLTEELTRAIHAAVDRGRRAVCVVNRKGRAQLLICGNCDEVAQCEVCASAVVEADDGGLVCPRCDTHRPRVCLNCGSTKLKRLRPGIARLHEELAALLPSATVAEVDASTGDVPDAAVLVGTESVLHRGWRGGEIGLVAFLDFDQELLAPRVRAAEQAAALLVRAGRVLGPRSRGGRILVQTRLPDHVVVTAAAQADPIPVLDETVEITQSLQYPPFGGLAKLAGDGDAVRLAADLLRAAGLDVRGPAADGTALVRAETADSLADVMGPIIPEAKAAGRLRVQVDPIRL